ncbi:MAG: dienelactone hydrolase family protein [Candidatus Peribacteraceae bacterium]|nr:dienelactone hydrolase family protein [Candidatus Peribacteraceae bacterium]
MRTIASLLGLTLLLTACTASLPTENGNGATSSSVSSAAQTVRAEEVVYGPATGYLALPAGDGPFPAVVLIHEWWGLNDNMRDYAEQFARQGYVALAADLYGGESTEDPARAQELAAGVAGNPTAALQNLQSAVAYVRGLPDVDGERLASVGWCFGGGWSYQMARNDLGVQATVMYYGRFMPDDDLSQMKADIIGHFGEDDESIPVDDVRAFQARLQTQGGTHEIYIYPNRGHGFARELDNPDAVQAWDRTLAFLREHL